MNLTNCFLVLCAFAPASCAFHASDMIRRSPSASALTTLTRSSLIFDTLEDSSTTFVASTTVTPPSTVGRDLPPLLQDMVDERREFEMNLGKAMDTLRKDYPTILTKMPDFDIYNEEINVVDPSGVQLTGLNSYKNSFSFLQTLVRFFYNTSASGVQSRMVYDFARQSIRISWNAVLVPKMVGNRRNALYVDGISIYKMDSKSGKIIEHRVENMLINDIPITPPYGIFSALKDELMNPVRVPVGVGVGAMFDTAR